MKIVTLTFPVSKSDIETGVWILHDETINVVADKCGAQAGDSGMGLGERDLEFNCPNPERFLVMLSEAGFDVLVHLPKDDESPLFARLDKKVCEVCDTIKSRKDGR